MSGSRRGVVLVDVFLDALLEDAVGLEDEVNRIPAGALSAGIRRDVVGRSLGLLVP